MSTPSAPPILSTPESHIFEDATPVLRKDENPRYTDAELYNIYEIARTVKEVCEGGHKRIALQFPDAMLRDSVRVFSMLESGCKDWSLRGKNGEDAERKVAEEGIETDINALATATSRPRSSSKPYFSILADTSYGSCCVDEIAAQHISATLLVHYGRSCLSPTSRIPVLYVYTSPPLSVLSVLESFVTLFPDRSEKVLLMADITYYSHVPAIFEALRKEGYTEITAPDVVREPESVVPNRRVEDEVKEKLGEYNLFHVSEPAPALLLTLVSRVKEMYIYPTTSSSLSERNKLVTPKALKQQTSVILRRRYALVTYLSTAPIIGILINTLSVSHHLAALASLKSLIANAGKKSYTFVVGKVNAAKLANFSEIGGWVVVGCWESSLVDGEGFYKGVVTPFELGVALKGAGRVWDGSWRGDFGAVTATADSISADGSGGADAEKTLSEGGDAHVDSESESEPPEYDLRTGRYISHSRPMRTTLPLPSSLTTSSPAQQNTAASQILTRRAKGDVAIINGTASPGAEFLRSQRTWTGLGSDFDFEEEAPLDIEEGRAGVARGYSVAQGERR